MIPDGKLNATGKRQECFMPFHNSRWLVQFIRGVVNNQKVVNIPENSSHTTHFPNLENSMGLKTIKYVRKNGSHTRSDTDGTLSEEKLPVKRGICRSQIKSEMVYKGIDTNTICILEGNCTVLFYTTRHGLRQELMWIRAIQTFRVEWRCTAKLQMVII